jgi:trehalose 6-phosphate phosphatase
VRGAVERLVGEQPGRFAALAGRKLMEIRPRKVDKGWAVERLMRDPPFMGRTPVFIGDDATDEDGFEAARSHGGYGLNVHRYFPSGAASVRDWLEDRLGVLQAGCPHETS